MSWLEKLLPPKIQQTVDTRLAGVGDEATRAVALVIALDRVGVAHQHHGGA